MLLFSSMNRLIRIVLDLSFIGVVLTQVRVAEYCNAVNVLWVATETPKDQEIESLLPSAARKLR